MLFNTALLMMTATVAPEMDAAPIAMPATATANSAGAEAKTSAIAATTTAPFDTGTGDTATRDTGTGDTGTRDTVTIDIKDAPRDPVTGAPPIGFGNVALPRDEGREQVTIPTEEKQLYRQFFAAIDAGRWGDAQKLLGQMNRGPIRDYATAEYLTAAGSPRAEASQILPVLKSTPSLPQAPQLARMAEGRGATNIPALPSVQPIRFLGEAPRRKTNPPSIASDVAPGALRAVQERIKADDPAGAEAAIASSGASGAARTELQARVAWSYYIENRDDDAARVADAGMVGSGPWAIQAKWVRALAAWRARDCATAAPLFEQVSASASYDPELVAAGAYWAGRARMQCRTPNAVTPNLRRAAQYPTTFYGQLAQEQLAQRSRTQKPRDVLKGRTMDRLLAQDNVRIAIALADIGQEDRASEVLRYHATIADPRDYDALIALTQGLSLPVTQLNMAHYGPAKVRLPDFAYYPVPKWKPTYGWRVDPNLVFAHGLQESSFRKAVVSPAGATGIMQVVPGTARGIAAQRGFAYQPGQLTNPSFNIEYGQSYLEGLSTSDVTQGRLPKVIAAYNAGPTPVARWNTEIRDNNDPLLYIESIPYWETRGYVGTVLRNYWVYQDLTGAVSPSRTALVQGHWPMFPTMGNGPASAQSILTRE